MNNDNALRSLIAKQAARQQTQVKAVAQTKRDQAKHKAAVKAMHRVGRTTVVTR